MAHPRMYFWSLALLPLLAAWHALALAARGIPPPNEDPFFKPPSGWENKPLGTIFRSRQITAKGLFDLKLAEAWQILYRTSYVSEDQPTTTVTTILVPHNAMRDKVVVFGDIEDANGPQCAPSYGFLEGLQDDLFFPLNSALVMPYLQEGYIVTVPDKQGNLNAFGSGRVEGHQTLDGIRATLAFDKLNLTSDVKVAGWGYSGGAIQLGWAAALKKKYAPELPMVGWYMGGTPSDIGALVKKLNKSSYSGFLVSGLTGLMLTYSSLNDYIHKVAKQKLLDAINTALHSCTLDMTIKFPFQDFTGSDYSTAGAALLSNPVIEEVYDQVQMGKYADETPDTPVLMVHAKNDEIAPYSAATQTRDSWCANGADLEFVTYDNPLSVHVTTTVTPMTSSFLWIKDRFNGKSVSKGCSSSTNHDLLLDTKALGPDFEQILGILEGMLEQDIGPGDKHIQQRIADGH